MFCPACGAENKDPGQRYCRECGATLPVSESRSQAVTRIGKSSLPVRVSGDDSGKILGFEGTLKNRVIIGAVGLVVAVVALNVIIHLIIATVTAILLPLTVVAALVLIGYYYLRNLGRR